MELVALSGLMRLLQRQGLTRQTGQLHCTGIKANITADYNSYGKLQYICNEQGVDVLNTGFGADVDMELVVKAETAGAFEKKITECSFGEYNIEK